MEERINLTTGNAGSRARRLLQISHPLPNMKCLSACVGDEVLAYVNQNNFGKQGLPKTVFLAD